MLAVPTLPTDTPPRTVVSLNPRPQWATGEGPEDRVQSRALTGRDFLTGTSFALTGGLAEAGGYAALWGRGAISRFDGREGDLTLDGEVATGLMGADSRTRAATTASAGA